MSDNFDPQNDLTDRLSALGRQPVSSALQSEHLTAMASVPRGASWRGALASRVKIGAAVLGGFLIGTTGLATAGVLGPMQSIAKTTVEAVTPLEVPDGHDGADTAKAAKAKNDAETEKAVLTDGSIGTARDWSDGCAPTATGGAIFAGNRGQYLKQERAKGEAQFQAAKDSTCGKPLADDDEGVTAEEPKGADVETEADDHGKSADKRKDGDHPKANAPAKTEADDAAETPEAPEAPEVESEHSRVDSSGSGSSGSGRSGSDDASHSGSGS